MTTPNATRQGLLPGVTADSRKSVNATKRPRQASVVPQKGITIGANWRVSSDSMNVILSRRVKTKSGKEAWETVGYFSTLGHALVGLVRQGVRDTQLESIQAVQDRIAQLEHDILKMAAGK